VTKLQTKPAIKLLFIPLKRAHLSGKVLDLLPVSSAKCQKTTTAHTQNLLYLRQAG